MRRSKFCSLLALILLSLALASLTTPAEAALTVSTNADAGAGSLRQALLDANADAGADIIEFSLAPADLVIAPLTPLPAATAPIIVDGTSQPGWAGSPLVELDGSITGGIGIFLSASDSTILGLVIRNFDRGIEISGNDNEVGGCRIGTDATGTISHGNAELGIGISGDGNRIGSANPSESNLISGNGNGVLLYATGNGNLIQGNSIGTTADGSAPLGNTLSGIRVLGDGNLIGGVGAGEGNLISGNGTGVSLESLGNMALGNRIGLDASGTVALGNVGYGIQITGANNAVGGPSAGARNVISANGGGVTIYGVGSNDNLVRGNYIGTTEDGSAALGNVQTGVRVQSQSNLIGGSGAGEGNLISANQQGISVEAPGNAVLGNIVGLDVSGMIALGNSAYGVWLSSASNVVGGAAAGAGNVISANGTGIGISGEDSDANEILGNLIGTDAAGSVGLGNTFAGVRVLGGSSNRIGDADPGAGNVISGNYRGITLEAVASGNIVQGNIIGLDAATTTSIANDASGLTIHGPGNQIGGTGPGEGNVISGNGYHGIFLTTPNATENVIEGNEIGTLVEGESPLRNDIVGIRLFGAFDNTIGGTAPGAGNIIAGNGTWGVFIESGTGNRILGNSIFQNGTLGIDHHLYGPTGNDSLDADFGPNLGQNHPVVESVLVAAGETSIEGQLASSPDTSARVEFFSGPSCDLSGFGEGQTFIGAVDVVTNAAGIATIAATLPLEVSDAFVSATATNEDGNTSEFSPCALVGGPNPGVLQFSTDMFISYEYDGTATVTVTRSHGSSGSISVDYFSSDNSATAPADYAAVAGTLTFEDGEVLKTFEVPVFVDALAEGGEILALTIEAPTGGALLGAGSVSALWIGDANPSLPTVFFSDAQLVEGNAGTTDMAFTVTVSPNDVSVTVGYATLDGTAVAGSDYEALSGSLIFAAGETEKTVLVPVFGDANEESDEIFFLDITTLENATVTDGLGEGVVLNDDAAVPPTPLCVAGTTITKPRIVIAGIGGDPGNERISLKGNLEFSVGSPAGFAVLDATNRGAQIRIEDLGAGTSIFDRTAESHPIPAGGLGASPCDPAAQTKDGWKTNQNETAYVYRNRTGALPSAACAPGSAQGLHRLALKDRRTSKGYVHVVVATRDATIDAPIGPFRVTIVLDADPAAGQSGACGVHEFGVSDCQWNESGKKLVCD